MAEGQLSWDVTAPDGQKFTLTGDHTPSEAELNDLWEKSGHAKPSLTGLEHATGIGPEPPPPSIGTRMKNAVGPGLRGVGDALGINAVLSSAHLPSPQETEANPRDQATRDVTRRSMWLGTSLAAGADIVDAARGSGGLVAAATTALAHASPIIKYEVYRTGMRAAGLPDAVATPLAYALAGYSGRGRGPAEPTIPEYQGTPKERAWLGTVGNPAPAPMQPSTAAPPPDAWDRLFAERRAAQAGASEPSADRYMPNVSTAGTGTDTTPFDQLVQRYAGAQGPRVWTEEATVNPTAWKEAAPTAATAPKITTETAKQVDALLQDGKSPAEIQQALVQRVKAEGQRIYDQARQTGQVSEADINAAMARVKSPRVGPFVSNRLVGPTPGIDTDPYTTVIKKFPIKKFIDAGFTKADIRTAMDILRDEPTLTQDALIARVKGSPTAWKEAAPTAAAAPKITTETAKQVDALLQGGKSPAEIQQALAQGGSRRPFVSKRLVGPTPGIDTDPYTTVIKKFIDAGFTKADIRTAMDILRDEPTLTQDALIARVKGSP
jgi:hypothetical protein